MLLGVALRHELRLGERTVGIAERGGSRRCKTDGGGVAAAIARPRLVDERETALEVVGVAGHAGEHRHHLRRQRRAVEDAGEHLPSRGREVALGERRQDVAQRALGLDIGFAEQTTEDAARVVVARHLERDGAGEPQGLDVLRVELEQTLRGAPGGRQMSTGFGDLDGSIGDRRVARSAGVALEAFGGHAAIAGGETALAGALRRGGRRRGVRTDPLRLDERGAEQQGRAGGSGDRGADQGTHLGSTIAEP